MSNFESVLSPSPARPTLTLRLASPGWLRASAALVLGLCLLSPGPSRASGAKHEEAPAKAEAPAAKPAASQPARSTAEQVREAVENTPPGGKKLTLVVTGNDKQFVAATLKEMPPAEAAPAAPAARPPATQARPSARPVVRRPYAPAASGHGATPERTAATAALAAQAATAGHDAEVHWDYEGDNGPRNWGRLKPEFSLCGTGKRQSPINIDDSMTLQGPAEPIQFNYTPSNASVVNNGHTIQVDVSGDNFIVVRGSTYRLAQFHFHTPSEEQINYRHYAMVAHLVHKGPEGQLAVVAVLLTPGQANNLINTVWTYMPIDAQDRVRVPSGLLDLNELLPKDQRYYQFMGSLTTPPCSEGVLWLVLKQPTTVSREQIRLFTQLFPYNARPVQPVNGRPVRSAQ